MGLDLYLLPFDCDSPDLCFSHTILNCERESFLFIKISNLSDDIGVIVPDYFTGFLSRKESGDSCYGKIIEDPYGDPIKYVNANKLIDAWKTEYVKNEAILEYLKCLYGTTKIALYWH